jgi:hypothetical protein
LTTFSTFIELFKEVKNIETGGVVLARVHISNRNKGLRPLLLDCDTYDRKIGKLVD